MIGNCVCVGNNNNPIGLILGLMMVDSSNSATGSLMLGLIAMLLLGLNRTGSRPSEPYGPYGAGISYFIGDFMDVSEIESLP